MIWCWGCYASVPLLKELASLPQHGCEGKFESTCRIFVEINLKNLSEKHSPPPFPCWDFWMVSPLRKNKTKKKPSTTKHDQSKQIHFPQNSTPHCRERCSLPFLFLGSGSSLLIVSNSFHLEGPQMIIRLDTFRSLHYQGSAPPQQNESSSPNVMEIQSRMISFFAWGLMSRNCQPKIETKLPKGGLFRNSKRKIRVNFCIFRISLWRNSCGSSKSWAPNGLVKFKAFTQSFAFTVVVQTKESR